MNYNGLNEYLWKLICQWSHLSSWISALVCVPDTFKNVYMSYLFLEHGRSKSELTVPLHPAPNPAPTSSLSSFCLTKSPSVYFGESYFTWGSMSPGNTGGYVPAPNIHGLISIPELKDARVGRDGGPTPALQRRNHTPEGICENLRQSCPKAPSCHMAQGSVLSRYHMAFLSSCFSRCFRSWSFKSLPISLTPTCYWTIQLAQGLDKVIASPINSAPVSDEPGSPEISNSQRIGTFHY